MTAPSPELATTLRELAGDAARDLNLPWDDGRLTMKRALLGGLTGIWFVTSVVQTELPDVYCTVKLSVNVKNGKAYPVRTRYRTHSQT